MKFDTLRLVDPSGATTVDFPIIGADPSGPFVLKGAEGLGPVEVNVVYADMVEEGGVRQKKRAVNRQIVALVGLQPDWSNGITPGDLRTVLYGLLTPRFDAQIVVQLVRAGVVIGQAEGDISKFEASVFSKDPEVQITIDCDYPYFTAPMKAVNPAIFADGSYGIIDITNEGTAPAGFWLGIKLNSAHGGTLQLSEDAGVSPKVLNINGGFVAGESFIYDTRPGSQGFWRVAPGSSVAVAALGDLNASSPWLKMHGGANRFRLNHADISQYLFGVIYTPAFWGV